MEPRRSKSIFAKKWYTTTVACIWLKSLGEKVGMIEYYTYNTVALAINSLPIDILPVGVEHHKQQRKGNAGRASLGKAIPAALCHGELRSTRNMNHTVVVLGLLFGTGCYIDLLLFDQRRRLCKIAPGFHDAAIMSYRLPRLVEDTNYDTYVRLSRTHRVPRSTNERNTAER